MTDLADHMIAGFRQHLRAEVVPAEGVCLISKRSVTMLSGASVELLAPLPDGTRTIGDVKREVPECIPAAEVQLLPGRLWAARRIAVRPALEAAQAGGAASTYWSLAGLDPDSAARAIGSAGIAMVAMGIISAAMATAVCEEAGLTVSGPLTDADVSFVIAALELAKWLAGFRHAGQHGEHIMDTLSLRGEHHPVRRRPQCLACGDPSAMPRRWNVTCLPAHRVPEPFDEDAVIEWTPVWSLLRGAQRLLPTALLYFSPVTLRELVRVTATSNGTAIGGSRDDAVSRGFLELVKRDAIAIWWYNRARRPAVDVESFRDPWVSHLCSWFEKLNRRFWVLDVTADLGVPVMAAVSQRVDNSADDIVMGFGAHFSPHAALRRALAELVQMQVSAHGGGPDLLLWRSRATASSQPHLLPSTTEAPRSIADYRWPRADGPGIDQACDIVRAAGLDLLALDMTRPDIGMPVVKVVVPGLRHFLPRFAPGRLFDVPVRLGRATEPTTYEALNPVPLYT